MARFEAKSDGMNSLSEDLKKLGKLTVEDAYTILTPAAEHMEQSFAEKIRGMFEQHTGKLAESIKALRKKDDVPYILVAPQGVHHRYRSRKKNKKGKAGGMKNAHASEVAFILEYGDGHHKAHHWMEKTIEEEGAAIGEKLQEGFDALCDEKGVGV